MGRVDRAALLLHVAPDQVFRALTDPDALVQWLPPRGMSGQFERFDMREGGSYRLALTYDDATGGLGKTSTDSDISEVRISRMVENVVLVQEVDFESDDPAFQGTMTMEWRLRGASEGTTVEFEARNVPDGIRARDHAEGLTSSLSNLAGYLEP